jgi:hypothetical protein
MVGADEKVLFVPLIVFFLSIIALIHFFEVLNLYYRTSRSLPVFRCVESRKGKHGPFLAIIF